jgi:hypothetical protein
MMGETPELCQSVGLGGSTVVSGHLNKSTETIALGLIAANS